METSVTIRIFKVGDLVRFRYDAVLRYSYKVEANDVGRVTGLPDDDGTAIVRLNVAFPRVQVRNAEAAYFISATAS
jgi:hypothetical protein